MVGLWIRDMKKCRPLKKCQRKRHSCCLCHKMDLRIDKHLQRYHKLKLGSLNYMQCLKKSKKVLPEDDKGGVSEVVIDPLNDALKEFYQHLCSMDSGKAFSSEKARKQHVYQVCLIQ